MNPGKKNSNGRNLRGLFGFVPHIFLIILLLLVMRCEPFSVAVNVNTTAGTAGTVVPEKVYAIDNGQVGDAVYFGMGCTHTR